MQFDYILWLHKYAIIVGLILGALILVLLAWNHYARGQFEDMGDSDRLQTPTYEQMDSGVVVSDPDDEDDP
ncbi:MAG: hypothetical protein ACFFEK_12885 [Candidatus Thorarchaeota archaeon]